MNGHDIPGRHTRICPTCETEVTVDEGTSVLVSAERDAVIHAAPCPSCGAVIRYSTRPGETGSTDRDVRRTLRERFAGLLRRRNT